MFLYKNSILLNFYLNALIKITRFFIRKITELIIIIRSIINSCLFYHMAISIPDDLWVHKILFELPWLQIQKFSQTSKKNSQIVRKMKKSFCKSFDIKTQQLFIKKQTELYDELAKGIIDGLLIEQTLKAIPRSISWCDKQISSLSDSRLILIFKKLKIHNQVFTEKLRNFKFQNFPSNRIIKHHSTLLINLNSQLFIDGQFSHGNYFNWTHGSLIKFINHFDKSIIKIRKSQPSDAINRMIDILNYYQFQRIKVSVNDYIHDVAYKFLSPKIQPFSWSIYNGCTNCKQKNHEWLFCPDNHCSVCDTTGHPIEVCPNVICNECRQNGHLGKICPSKNNRKKYKHKRQFGSIKILKQPQ